MRIIYAVLIFFTFVISCLYPFGGKPIKMRDIRLYYTTSANAKIEVYIYSNTSGNTNLDYLSYTLADAVANQIEHNKTIKLSESNISLRPVNFESAYDYKVFEFTNISYTTKLVGSNIEIVTNTYNTYYTNWEGVKSNVTIITPESKDFKLETNEILFNYHGTNVILKNANDFTKNVEIGNIYYQYFGDDIKEYVFTRDAEIAIFGTIDQKRPNVVITTYIADIKSRQLTSYTINLPEATIDEQIPNYSLEIANRISHLDKTGVISLNVEPPGAFVYVDNVFIGKSGNTLYIPALTTNTHRFTIKKDLYEPVDTMISFEKPNQNVLLNFNLTEMTNMGYVKIDIPGGTNSAVVLNGILEPPTNVIERNFQFGTYALKITNTNYMDYYGTFTISNTNTLFFTPSMKQYKTPTLAQRIFGNYERNTKIFLGLTIASTIFTVGSFIYANEVLDSAAVKHQSTQPNLPFVKPKNYEIAMNLYWAGIGISAAFALTAGVYYMLWISEPDFPVEQITFSAGGGGANIAFSKRF